MRTNYHHGCNTVEKIKAGKKMAFRRHTLSSVEYSSSCPALFAYGSNTSVSNGRSSSPCHLKNAPHRLDCISQVLSAHFHVCVHFLITLAEQGVFSQKQTWEKESRTPALQQLEQNECLVRSKHGPQELDYEVLSSSTHRNAENGATPLQGQNYGQTHISRY